jgi:hypothetical protein
MSVSMSNTEKHALDSVTTFPDLDVSDNSYLGIGDYTALQKKSFSPPSLLF